MWTRPGLVQYRDRIGALLLDSQLVYAGRGYCVALARFETAADADLLCAYLDRYLPRTDFHYDQHWAIGALLHLDERLGSNRADRFLTPGGLWEKSATSQYDPAERHRYLTRLCAFADDCMRDPGPPGDTPENQPDPSYPRPESTRIGHPVFSASGGAGGGMDDGARDRRSRPATRRLIPSREHRRGSAHIYHA
jgi:hypothetical protein